MQKITHMCGLLFHLLKAEEEVRVGGRSEGQAATECKIGTEVIKAQMIKLDQ